MVELKQKKMTSCQKITKSVTDCLLELEDVAIICIGPASCLRTFYFQEGELDVLDHVFLCQLDQTDYLTGDIYPKLEKVVEEAVKKRPLKGIVLFAGCSDYIIQTDYDSMLEDLEQTFSLPFFQIWRGPIAKCQHNSKDEIKEIAEKLKNVPVTKVVEKENEKQLMPVLASDIAGVASLIEDWDCMTILYTPGSCMESFAESSLLVRQSNFYHTHFSDVDLSLGGTSDIVEFVLQNYDGKKDVCLVGSPLNHFVHGDYEELADELKNHGISCLPFITEGFEEAQVGISQALLSAGKHFLSDKTEKNQTKKQINLIGFTKLTLGNVIDINELEHCLGLSGYTLNMVAGNLRESFLKVLDGQVNWVVSEEGVSLAKWLEEEYEMPYIVDLPIGSSGVTACFDQLSTFCKSVLIDPSEAIKDQLDMTAKKVLLIGEPLVNKAIERMLRVDIGIQSITCRTYLPTENLTYFYPKHVLGFSTLDELLAEKETYDVIVGDSIYKKTFKKYYPNSLFIPLNYGVISGVNIQEKQTLTAENGNNWFANQLK